MKNSHGKIINEKIEGILNSLSIDEKIRLLNGVGSWDTFDANGKIPVISMSDGPHGLRHQTGKEDYSDINQSNIATCFPTASCIASSWNRKSLEKMGRFIAKEAKSENVQIVLGPGLNIKRSPLCGRNFEYFSEDPLLAGEFAASFVNGMQSEGVGSCLKHFALNNQEKNRQSSSSNVDERTLREIYLKGFETAVKKARPVSVMSSYNMINGTYASCNRTLLSILKNEWGFDGLVMSDWGGNMNCVESLKAGLDLGMPDSCGYFGKKIKAAYENGSVTEEEIDNACKNIIRGVLLLKKNCTENSVLGAESDLQNGFQHETSLELALDSAVLLKNDGFLPLKHGEKDGTKPKLIVIGSLAENMRFQGGGSSHVSTQKQPSALEALSKDFDVSYIPAYYSKFCPVSKKKKIDLRLAKEGIKTLKETLALDKGLPVIYFCGLTDDYEGEGFDRKNLMLPDVQVEFYREIEKLTQNIVLVNFSGSPVDLTFAKNSRAILQMYLAGEACGEAVCTLLEGKSNPAGHLAETWPLENYIKPEKDISVNYTEGVLVGYRRYETLKIPVQYEFGFGLSYTSFEYSDLKIVQDSSSGSQGFKVSVKVRNTGAVAGSEVVQLYVKNPLPIEESGISRSAIELRGFEKVFLESGEEKTVEFNLDQKDFSVYSTVKKDFAPVAGSYEVCVASSVKNVRLSKTVQVEGEKIDALTEKDSELQKKVFVQMEPHKKGQITVSDSLGLMAANSLFVRIFLKVLKFAVIRQSKSKSRDDPAVKITLAALEENPLESLMSTASTVFNEKLVGRILRHANR